jgi:eIF3 subunit M, C-terminal helix
MQMRMMALVALCAGREGDDVPFAEVAAALKLDDGSAEAWLVRAFGKLLVDGRIDQARPFCMWNDILCVTLLARAPAQVAQRMYATSPSKRCHGQCQAVAWCRESKRGVRAVQVAETVHVRRCERRVFGEAEWARLQGDLETWRDNLKGIEVTMKEQTLLTPTSTVQRWLSS